MYKIICGLYLGGWVGYGASLVGKTPEVLSGAYSTELPFKLLAVFALPVLLGYLAGREDAQ